VVQLEKKLDDLVNLLSGPKGQGGMNEQAQISMTEPVSNSSPTSVHQTNQTSAGLVDSGHQTVLDSPQDTSPYPMTHAPQIKRSHFDLPSHECAFLLLEFRTSMAPQFPFVVIPPEATSESLRIERPMLWKAIVTAASCLTPSRQEAMGMEIMEEFGTRLLLKATTSSKNYFFDVLQALLIHLAW
jgi:hypothetical protein